jgi:hypothetical protein
MRAFAIHAAESNLVNYFVTCDGPPQNIGNGFVATEISDVPQKPEGRGWALQLTPLEWVNVETLEDAKSTRWESIKSRREALDEESINVPGRVFGVDANASSRMDLLGAIAAMQASGDATRRWRCADNVMRELTLADLLAVGGAIAARRQSLIETSDLLYQQIQAAVSVAEVQTIVWPDST